MMGTNSIVYLLVLTMGNADSFVKNYFHSPAFTDVIDNLNYAANMDIDNNQPRANFISMRRRDPASGQENPDLERKDSDFQPIVGIDNLYLPFPKNDKLRSLEEATDLVEEELDDNIKEYWRRKQQLEEQRQREEKERKERQRRRHQGLNGYPIVFRHHGSSTANVPATARNPTKYGQPPQNGATQSQWQSRRRQRNDLPSFSRKLSRSPSTRQDYVKSDPASPQNDEKVKFTGLISQKPQVDAKLPLEGRAYHHKPYTYREGRANIKAYRGPSVKKGYGYFAPWGYSSYVPSDLSYYH